MSENTIKASAVEDATTGIEAPAVDAAPDDAAGVDDMTQPEADDEAEAGDVFPRKVVEKLRKESATLRDRAKTAEDRLSALQRQSVASQITAAGMRPEAVWAVATVDDLLADDGTVDTAAVARAMATARQTLGITRRRNPAGSGSGLKSGASTGEPSQPVGFAAAFGPRNQ